MFQTTHTAETYQKEGLSAMNPSVGNLIVTEMKKRGTGPKLWACSRGFHPRTVNEVLHHDLGGKRGGKKTDAIFAALIDEGYIDVNHEFLHATDEAV